MLQRLGQIVSVVLLSSALVSSYANAQRGAGAPSSVAVAPRVMAVPIAAAPVHAGAVHFAAGSHAPAHLGPSAIAHPTVPHRPVPVKPVSPRPPARIYPAPSQSGFSNMPFPNNGFNNGFNDGFNNGNFPVPGLGFDYAHFAAVHPGVFRHHFQGGGVVPFIGGGLYVPFEYYSEPYPAPEQPAAEPDVEPEQVQTAPQQDYSLPLRPRPNTFSSAATAPFSSPWPIPGAMAACSTSRKRVFAESFHSLPSISTPPHSSTSSAAFLSALPPDPVLL
jgi:hypothetical protein